MPFEDIKRIVSEIAEGYGVERVYLFGSRARMDYRDDSDYDFLISKGKVDTLLKYVSLINELEKRLNSHVDVVTDTSDDSDFLEAIRKDLRLVYEQQR